MATNEWDRARAAAYDESVAAMSSASVVEPTADLLAALARGGPALELAIGTGRIALPLAERGVEVHGVELSTAMVEELCAKPGGADLDVVVGDMTSVRLDRTFSLVFLVFNTIENVTTQDEQVATFATAAAHLASGGCFVVEVAVPRLGAPDRPRVFTMEADHVGVDTHDDPVHQLLTSHHWYEAGGRLVHDAETYRYVWPSELDLMARLAGLRVRERWEDWRRTPFTAASDTQVVVYEKA